MAESITCNEETPPPPTLIKQEEEIRDEQNIQQAEPNESLKLLALDLGNPKTIVRLGTRIEPEMRRWMKRFPTEHQDVFA